MFKYGYILTYLNGDVFGNDIRHIRIKGIFIIYFLDQYSNRDFNTLCISS